MYRMIIMCSLLAGCSSTQTKAEIDVGKEAVPVVEKVDVPVTDDWHGVLDLTVMKLRLSFHITEADGILTSTMDSLDQGSTGNPTTSTTFENGKLKIIIEAIGAGYPVT